MASEEQLVVRGGPSDRNDACLMAKQIIRGIGSGGSRRRWHGRFEPVTAAAPPIQRAVSHPARPAHGVT